MNRPLLITSVAALAAGGCLERTADDGTVATQQAALSATTGDISTTLLWNESIIQGSDADVFSVKVEGPSGTSQSVVPASGTHLAADLLPGSYSVSAHAFGCEMDPLAGNTFSVTANTTTQANLGLDLVAGRATWSIELDGAIVPATATAHLNHSCTMTICAIGSCEFFTRYDTTVGALMGKLLPYSMTDVEVESNGKRGVFGLSIPAAVTSNLGVIHAQSGKIEGRVLWNGAPIFDAARSLTVTGQSSFGGDSFQPYRAPWSAQPSTSGGGFSSGTVPTGQYGISVQGVSCANAEGSDAFGFQSVTLADGQTLQPDIDITSNAGSVVGSFSLPLSGTVRLDLNNGDCGSIQTNSDGHLDAFMPPGHYNATLWAVSAGLEVGAISFDVTAGETTNLGDNHLSLSQGSVSGVVTYGGPPVTGALTANLQLGGDLSGPVSAVDGSFFNDNVTIDSINIYVLLCDQIVGGFSFDPVPAPGNRSVDIDIAQSARRIVGTVTIDGSVAANATVTGPGCPFHTNAAGRLDELIPSMPFTFTELIDSAGRRAVANYSIDATGGGAGSTIDIGTVNFTIPVSLAPLGASCSSGSQCASSFCSDSVCCNADCGSDASDCQACGADGICALRTGQTCGATPNMCQTAGLCAATASCPGPATIAACGLAHVASCSTAPCPLITLPGPGAASAIDHMTVQLGPPLGSGDLSVRPCDVAAPPPNGYQIMRDPTDAQACLDVEVGPTVTPAGSITVCVFYADALLSDGAGGTLDENILELYHGEGGGWRKVTTVKNAGANELCGAVTSMSPFAIMAPTDRKPPVFGNLPPNPLIAYATSTAGATVSFAPKAVDAVDGPVAVSCSRAAGLFPVGKTAVTCTATDASHNTATTSFDVWVQYQAPGDGTFFLSPVRADGKSVFKIGRAVPVKFALNGASAGITNLVARLVVMKVSGSVTGNVDCVGDEDGEDTDMIFKYRKAKGLYGYRWKTSNQTKGTYQLRADLGDGVTHVINVSLK